MVYGLREALRAIRTEGLAARFARHRLIADFGIEIGAAFGPLQGRIWRIGTMGYSARRENILLCLAALESVLRREGWKAEGGAGAALAHYAASGVAAGATGLDVDESLGAGGIGRI